MKTALEINEQIAKLKERGMIIDDEAKAKEILLDVGYYRLGFYTFPFERKVVEWRRCVHRCSRSEILRHRDHILMEGIKFDDIVELYYFDTDLRRLLMCFINRIEVNFRTQITYTVSNHYRHDPVWFVDPAVVSHEYIVSFPTVYDGIRKNDVIKLHHRKYPNEEYAPAWKTLEFMTMGNVCALYSSLKEESLKREIAKRYHCSLDSFCNYIETIRRLRNKCAHGNCLYDVQIAEGLKTHPADISEQNRHNIAGAIGVVKYLIAQISHNRLNDLNKGLEKILTATRSSNTTITIKETTGLLAG